MVIVDAHLDLAYNVERGRDVRQPASTQPIVDNEIATVGLPDLREGGVNLICATIFCPPATYIPKRGGYHTADEAHAIARRQYGWYQQQIAAGELQMVRSKAELQSAVRAPQSAIPFILLMEGADAFRTPDDVRTWYSDGLRIVGLAWRKTRMAGGTEAPGPLTEEGRQVVRALDAVGIIHDLSHLADEAFWQLLDATYGPVMASHSNCRHIVPTDRQLTDEMIAAIVKRGGVIGINFYDRFLMPPDDVGRRRCDLSDVLAHVNRICDIAGSPLHVAIGTDMDGGLGREEIPHEVRTIADLRRVGDALSAAGYGATDVRNIMGENWVRFFARHLPG